MKRIKNWSVFESVNLYDFKKIWEILQRDCSKFLELLSQHKVKGIYRGSSIQHDPIIPGLWKFESNLKRTPKDTNKKIHDLIDKELEYKFCIPLRSMGVFATKYLSIASDYPGGAYLFFPIGEFRYFWNPYIDDLFTELRDNTTWYYKEPYFWTEEQELDFDEIISGYKEGGMEFIRLQEITFICQSYYLIDVEYYDYWLDYMNL